MNNDERLSIFIDSYDGNSDVWNSFFTVFDYFWKTCPFKRYLLTNNKDFYTKNLNVIKTGIETEWFLMTIEGLKKIQSKYIWFFFDDYFMSKFIAIEDVVEILDYMDKYEIFYYRLSLRKDLDRSQKCHIINSDFLYAINLQPAIWKREKLINLLEEIHSFGNKSPWDFERYFINYYESLNSKEPILGIRYDTRDLMGYKNAIIQGKWVKHVILFYKNKYSLIINTSCRKTMSFYEEFYDYIKEKSHIILNYHQRKRLKKLLRRLGFRFVVE